MTRGSVVQPSPARSSSYSNEANEAENGPGSSSAAAALPNGTRSLSLLDLQESGHSLESAPSLEMPPDAQSPTGLSGSGWVGRVGGPTLRRGAPQTPTTPNEAGPGGRAQMLAPLSFQNPVYQMAAGLPVSPRGGSGGGPGDSGSEGHSSVSSQGNPDDTPNAPKHGGFLPPSGGGGGGGGGSGSSGGEEFGVRRSGEFTTRRQLSLTETQQQQQGMPVPGSVPRQNSAGPQRRIDQPPPVTVTRGRTPPSVLSSAPYPRPSSGSMMSSSSPDWPAGGSRLRQQSSSSKGGDSPESKQRTLHKQVR